MSTASQFASSNTPVGSIVQGNFAGNSSYLLCDGSSYLKSSYPTLDTTGLMTWGTNTWTTRTLPATLQIHTSLFANGTFVVLGNATCYTSTDGINWTSRTFTPTATSNLTYGAGLFVALTMTGVVTSPDGITWTVRDQSWPSERYGQLAFGNGLFVNAGTGANDTATYFTSPDGITWTSRTNPSNIQNAGISFANGYFWLQSIYNNTGAAYSYGLFYSQDGIVWKSSALVDSPYYGIGSSYYTTINQGKVIQFRDKLLQWNTNKLYSSVDFFDSITFVRQLNQGLPPNGLSIVNNQLAIGSIASSTTQLQYSFDLKKWQLFTLPSAISGIGYTTSGFGGSQVGSALYGSNRIVMFQSANSTNYLTLDIDTTKFRTPSMTSPNEIPFYIRAK